MLSLVSLRLRVAKEDFEIAREEAMQKARDDLQAKQDLTQCQDAKPCKFMQILEPCGLHLLHALISLARSSLCRNWRCL